MTRALILALLLPANALAALAVEWDAPPECAPPALDLAGDGRAEVIVRERGGAWVVTVLVFEPTPGLRRVDAGSCEEAMRAAALLIELGVRGTSPTPSAPSPSPAPAPAEPPAVSAASPWSVSLGAGGALDVGSLPLAEPRLVVSGAVAYRALRIALDGRFGFEQALADAALVRRGFELQVAGCAHARLERFSGGPCLAVAGGTWRAATPSSRAEALVLSTSAQLRGALQLFAGLELGAVAGLRFNLWRPAPIDATGAIFVTPLLASELQLTVGWRW